MFNFFKKKRQLTEHDLKLLKKVVKVLPKKYSYLKAQVTEDFILDKTPDELGKEGEYGLVLDANLEKKFINNELPHLFIIKGIFIWNMKKKSFEEIELDIIQGVIFGFKILSDSSDFDLLNIDVKKVNEKHFDNKEVNELKAILDDLPEDLKSHLDIESSFKIEISEGVFFPIKDIGDGNYIAVNQLKEVFLLVHDPYQVNLISSDLSAFIKAMTREDFDVSDYLIQDHNI